MCAIQWFCVIYAADNKWRLPMGRKNPPVVRDANRRRSSDLEKSRESPTSDMGRRLLNVLYATSAGFCSSSAGTFGKIGMGVDEFFGIDNQARARPAFCNSSHVTFFFSPFCTGLLLVLCQIRHGNNGRVGQHWRLAVVHQIPAFRLHANVHRHQHRFQLHFHGRKTTHWRCNTTYYD